MINLILNLFGFGVKTAEPDLIKIEDRFEKQKYVKEVLSGKTYRQAVLMFPSYDFEVIGNGLMTADIRDDRIRVTIIDGKINMAVIG